MAGKYPNRGITAKVRERFGRSPGEILYVTDLASEFNVSERTIQQTIAAIRATVTGHGIVIEIAGRAWRWTQEESKAAQSNGKRVFEEIGITRSGEVIIQDESGAFYKAQEM